jgi:hypothetical protein
MKCLFYKVLGGLDEHYFSTKGKVSCTDKKGNATTFTIINNSKKQVCKIDIESIINLEKPNQKKCDYIVGLEDEKKTLFIELKGTDWKDGIVQIEETIKYANIRNLECKSREAFIIGKNIPKSRILLDTKTLINLKKNYNLKVNVKGDKYTFNI